MTDLTDEQIGSVTYSIREHLEHCVTALCDDDDFNALIAAIEARAARRERERISDEIAAFLDKEGSPPIWYEAVDIADPTYCERHPDEEDQ